MKISVTMPVYNNAPYIEEAILSILAQTYQNFEFIILDDASTDESPTIIERLSKQDERIRFYRNEKNQGIPASLNHLLELSTGEYVARMDGDDISLPQRFEREVETLKAHPDTDVIFTNTFLIDDKSRDLCPAWRPGTTKEILRLLPWHNYINHPSCIYRRQLALDAGGYDIRFRTGSDTDFFKRLLLRKARFLYLPEPLIRYRINPSSVRCKNKNSYPYKLAKVCLSNGHKDGAKARLPLLKGKERMDILLRIALPFSFLRRLLHTRNRFLYLIKEKVHR